MTTTTPYVPPRLYPPVMENRFRINYWATCNHYWQFNSDFTIRDLGARETFVRSQVNRRRDYFRLACIDNRANNAPSQAPDPSCCVACRDEDLLDHVPGYNSTWTNITNALDGLLPDTLTLADGLDAEDFKSVRFDGSASSCLRLGSLSADAPYSRICLQQPELCDYGISGSLWVNFTVENFAKEVLLATGSGYNQGFQFYTDRGKLCLNVAGAQGRWLACSDGFDRKIGLWRLLGFTWERYTGIIRIYIDNSVSTYYYLSTYQSTEAQGLPAAELRMGCEISGAATGSWSSTSYLQAQAVHPALWLWPISEDNLIILTGALVYKLIKYQPHMTTPQPTSPTKANFPYSTILKHLTYPTAGFNPYYEMADFYLRAGVGLGDLTSSVAASSNVAVTNWARGDTTEASFQISSNRAQLNVGNLSHSCLATQSLCSTGISASVWLQVAQSVPSGESEFLRFSVVSLRLVSAAGSIAVVVRAESRSISCLISYQRWINIGFVYDQRGAVLSLSLYINGVSCGTTNTGVTPSIGNHIASVTIGSSNFSGTTPSGAVLNHLAIWYRALEDFESHRFLGYTRDQYRFMRTASYYWTNDPVICGDSLILKDTTNYQLKSLYYFNFRNLIGSAIALEPDRYNKSMITRLSASWLGQFFLGNDIQQRPTEDSIDWAGKCITDPYLRKCQISGLTMHMWINIKSVDPVKKQFFFCSGDFADTRSVKLDTRGISLFTSGRLLGASVSTDRYDWTIVIDANRFKLDEWFNLGLTWSLQEGIRLFLNGIDYGIRNQRPDISYKAFDRHTRAIVGRFDDDQNSTWKDNPEWIMGNFSFTDLVFYERWLSPEEFAASVGSVNNRYYLESDLLIWGKQIIDTEFLLLKQAKMLSAPIGPFGNVSCDRTDFTKIGVNSQVGIKAFKADECPRRLSTCKTQVVVTLWLRLLTLSNSAPQTIITLGNETDQFEGFGLNVSTDGSLAAWVKPSGWTRRMVTRSKVKIRLGRWSNVALYLSQFSLYPTIFLNGTNVSASLEYVAAESTGGSAYSNSSSSGTLTVGRAADSMTAPNSSFQLFLLAGWFNRVLSSSQLNFIVGVQNSQYDLLRLADDYWTVAGLWSKLQPYPLQGINIDLSEDKFGTENGAMCTRGTGGSYVVLGNLQDSCLFDTSLCKAFSLTLVVKPVLPKLADTGYLFSSGGQNAGHLGTAVAVTGDGYLRAIVRSPNRTCIATAPFNYSDWVQLQIYWYADTNLAVKVNEVAITSSENFSASCWQETNVNRNSTMGQLGKLNSNASNAAAACFSDVMFKYQPLGATVAISTDITALCYEMFTTRLSLYAAGNSNYDNKANQSSRFVTSEYVDIGNEVCVFSGTGCSRGFTVSIWCRIEHVGTTDYFDVLSMGYPTNQGLRIRAKRISPAASDLALMVEANVAGKFWQVTIAESSVRQISIGAWANLAVSVSTSVAIEVYINGVQVVASTRFEVQSLTPATGTRALLGSASAVVLMSDLVFWNEPPISCLDPLKNMRVLTGVCSTGVGILPTTCLPSGSCQSTLINGICMDKEFSNVIAIGSSDRKFSSQMEADTACQVIAGTAEAKGYRSDFAQSSFDILTRISTNLQIVSGSTNNATLGTSLSAFSQAFSAVMNPKFADQFRSEIDSGRLNPTAMFSAVESLSLRLVFQLVTVCNPTTLTRGPLHWSQQVISSACIDQPIDALRYTDATRSLWMQPTDSVLLPVSLFTVLTKAGTNIKVACVVYDHINDLLPIDATNDTVTSTIVNGSIVLKVNSRVVSIVTSVPSTMTQRMDQPVNLTLQLVVPNKRSTTNGAVMQLETRCVFWDTRRTSSSIYGRGMWSTEGCVKLWEDETSVTCSCNHLTSFAVLMQPAPVYYNDINAQILAYIKYIFSCISLLCLLLFIIVVSYDKQLHGELYILELNLAAAVFLGQLAFVMTESAKSNADFCKAVSVMMHLFFVAGMAMLLAGSVWLFHAVVKGVIRGRLKWMLPPAWLLPVLIVATVTGINFQSYGFGPQCWLGDIFIWSFLGPLIGCGLLAMIVSLVVVCNLDQQAIKRRDIQMELSHQTRELATLAPLLTLAWLFAVPQTLVYTIPVQYIFIILNSSQGIFVLLSLGLMNPNFRDAAVAIICCGSKPVRHTRSDLNSSNVSVTGIQDIKENDVHREFDSGEQWTAGGGPSSCEAPVYHSKRPDHSEPGPSSQQSPDVGSFGGRLKLRDSQKSQSKKALVDD